MGPQLFVVHVPNMCSRMVGLGWGEGWGTGFRLFKDLIKVSLVLPSAQPSPPLLPIFVALIEHEPCKTDVWNIKSKYFVKRYGTFRAGNNKNGVRYFELMIVYR